jgi:WD40 repeat protein
LQFDATGKRLASRGIVRGSLMWDFDKRVVIDLFKTAGITLTPDFTLGAFAFPSGHLGIYDVEKKAADKNDVGLKAIHSVIPDDTGRFYAFGGGDDTIRVVDAAIGAILVTHRGHIGSAARILLRHDVRRLASAGEDGTVRIWEVPDPNEYKPYSGHHQTKVTAIDFSQDGEFLATGDYHGSIAIWNSSTGVREQVLGSHFVRRKINNKIPLEVGTNKPMTAGIAVKSVTSFVAPASIRDPIIECLTVQGHGGEVKSVAFTPDKRMVVSAGAKSFIIWDRISRQPVFEYEHPAIVSSMALSSDGTIAATGCWDDLVRVFRVPSGELIMTLEGHADDVMSVAFHPSGKELATGSRDQTVAIWDLATGKIKHQLRRHTNTVSVVRYTPDGKRLISGGMDGAIHVWNSATGQYEATLHGHLDGVTSMVLSGDGQWLVSASDGNDDKAVRVWLWNVDRFREGALVGGGFRGPSAVTIDPVTGDLIWGRVDLIRYRASPFSGNVSINAPPIFPEVTSATVAREDRLKVLGYSLIDEIGVWPTSDTTKVKPNQPGEKFLCVAVSLPFAKLKIGEADYLLRMEARRKDPEETLPSRASTMLMIPKRFVLVNRAGESRPADYVGRFAMRESDGFEFMGKGMSFLEDPTMTPQPQDRVLVYLAWEVLADFKLDGLNLRHQAEEAVPMPSVALTSFRPAMPFHPGSRSFLPSEGEGRLRSQMSRSPVP